MPNRCQPIFARADARPGRTAHCPHIEKVRFLADADLNEAIVIGVVRREPSLDFVTAHTSGLRRKSDSEVLALAAEQQRILVSHDVGTMPAHFFRFTIAGWLVSEAVEW